MVKNAKIACDYAYSISIMSKNDTVAGDELGETIIPENIFTVADIDFKVKKWHLAINRHGQYYCYHK